MEEKILKSLEKSVTLWRDFNKMNMAFVKQILLMLICGLLCSFYSPHYGPSPLSVLFGGIVLIAMVGLGVALFIDKYKKK